MYDVKIHHAMTYVARVLAMLLAVAQVITYVAKPSAGAADGANTAVGIAHEACAVASAYACAVVR